MEKRECTDIWKEFREKLKQDALTESRLFYTVRMMIIGLTFSLMAFYGSLRLLNVLHFRFMILNIFLILILRLWGKRSYIYGEKKK